MSKRTGDFGLCCGERTRVIDSRPGADHVLRRRVCRKCGQRFSTAEFHNDASDLMHSNPMLFARVMSMAPEKRELLNQFLRDVANIGL